MKPIETLTEKLILLPAPENQTKKHEKRAIKACLQPPDLNREPIH